MPRKKAPKKRIKRDKIRNLKKRTNHKTKMEVERDHLFATIFAELYLHYEVVDWTVKSMLLTKPEWQPIHKILEGNSSKSDGLTSLDLNGFWRLMLASRLIHGENIDDILKEHIKLNGEELRKQISNYVIEQFHYINSKFELDEFLKIKYPDVANAFEQRTKARTDKFINLLNELPNIINGLQDQQARRTLLDRIAKHKGESPLENRPLTFLAMLCVNDKNPEETVKVLTSLGKLSDEKFERQEDFVLR